MPAKKISELDLYNPAPAINSFGVFIPVEDIFTGANYKVPLAFGSSGLLLSYAQDGFEPSNTLVAGIGNAVAAGQDIWLDNSDSTALGSSLYSYGFGNSLIGYNHNITGDKNIAIGNNISETISDSVLVGNDLITYNALPSGATGGSVCLGANAGFNYQSVTIGAYASASYRNIAIGADSIADNGIFGAGAVAIGYLAQAFSTGTAIGSFTYSGGQASTALGYGATAENTDSLALGSQSYSSAVAGIAIGGNATAAAAAAIQLGGGTNTFESSLQFRNQTIATQDGGIKANFGTTPPALSGMNFAGTLFADASGLQYFDGLNWVIVGGSSPLFAKGDLYTHNGSADIRLPVGADGQMLVARSAAASGLAWEAQPNPYLTQEFLNRSTNLIIDANFGQSGRYVFVQPTAAIDIQITDTTVHSYYKIRSLNGANVITIRDESNNVIALLGNAVDNGNGVETKLLIELHRTATQLIGNLY